MVKRTCIKNKAPSINGKNYPIVCINSYEFEGREFLKGEISYQCWGMNIPEDWARATIEDLEKWSNRKNK